MRALVFCSSQYQIFNIIQLLENKILDVNQTIVIVFDFFDGAASITLKIKKKYAVIIYLIRINQSNNYLKGISIIKEIRRVRNDISYVSPEKIFISGMSSLKFLAYYICSNGGKCPYVMYEDGFESYTCNPSELFDSFGFAVAHLCKAFFKYKNIQFTKELYIYEPRLITFDNKNIVCKQIDNKLMNKDITLLSKFEFIFGITDSQSDINILSKARFIYFDQYITKNNRVINIDKIGRAVKMMGEYLGGDFIIKTHPRKEYAIQYDSLNIQLYKSGASLWELQVIGQSLTNKVLITIFSTAVFTPNILYNEKYKVILIYKIVINSTSCLYKKINAYVCQFKKYRNSIEVFVPETQTELEHLIKKLQKYTTAKQ